MSRSIAKGPFIDHFLRDCISETSQLVNLPIKLWSRRSCILPEFVNKNFDIHTGKSFIRLNVREHMIGHKFGEFAMTRKRPVHKKKVSKTKEKKK